MSALPGPSTRINAGRSPAFAALIRAVTASSGVLYSCANAPVAIVSKPIVAAARRHCRNHDKRRDWGADEIMILTSSLALVSGPGRRELCTRRHPPVVGLELQAELLVEDSEVAVTAAHNRLRHDRLHFLRHHTHVGLVAADIAEAVEPEAVVEMTEQGDVVLERDVGAPAAATTTATGARSATAAPGHARRSAAASAAHALAAAIGLGLRPGARLDV